VSTYDGVYFTKGFHFRLEIFEGDEERWVHDELHEKIEAKKFRTWNKYLFEGYAGHKKDMILLVGFPDISDSRPHSEENSEIFQNQ